MIQKNIKKIRTFKGLSQSGFAELFGLTRASVGAYEEGRAKPRTELAMEIAKYFSIPLELLLTKELTINDIANYEVSSEERPVHLLQHKNAQPPIQYVSSDQMSHYMKDFNKEEFINRLPEFSLPFALHRAERCFELDDIHFSFNADLFTPGEKLFCKNVKNVKKLDQTKYYLLLLENKMYLSTLIYDSVHKMVFNPRNTVEKIFESEILECWQIMSRLLPVPSTSNEKANEKLNKYLNL